MGTRNKKKRPRSLSTNDIQPSTKRQKQSQLNDIDDGEETEEISSYYSSTSEPIQSPTKQKNKNKKKTKANNEKEPERDENGKFKCSKCRRTFASNRGLASHQRAHKNKVPPRSQ